MIRFAPLALLPLILPAAVAQSPFDLNNWTAENYFAVSGGVVGDWVVAPDGQSVRQQNNSLPSMFYSPFNVAFLRIDGQIAVNTSSDDDLVGFAVGFQPGDATNPAADYLLIDWKRTSQTYNFGAPSCTPGSHCPAGLAVSRVRGIPTADELWGHVNLDTAPCSGPNDSVTELARAANLGATGWARRQTYSFRIDFTPTQLDVYVDGFLEISVSGTFPNGRVAFYNFSQQTVDYNAFTVSCMPGALPYGTGHPGTGGVVPSLTSSALPILGSTITLQGDNTSGGPSVGAFLYGFRAASQATPFGGTLLVDLIEADTVSVPGATGTTMLTVPNNPAICGFSLFSQFVVGDAGASHGIAFSPGLELVLGT